MTAVTVLHRLSRFKVVRLGVGYYGKALRISSLRMLSEFVGEKMFIIGWDRLCPEDLFVGL